MKTAARGARRAAARVAALARGHRIVAPPADEARGGGEAVLKLISSTRSRSSAGRMVWYVGRVRPQDRDDPGCARVRLHDETGAVLSRAEPGESFAQTRAATGSAVAGLALTAEGDNLKRSAPAARAGAAIAARDLRHSVAHHLAFSVGLRDPGEAELAEAACAAAVREVFGAEGYRCLWAMHGAEVAGAKGSRHHHVHVHMIVKAAHEFGGPRLRFGTGGVDVHDLRGIFAATARAAGLAAAATRREDRAEVRAAVAEGRAVLRPHRDRSRRAGAATALERRAPLWALANQAAMEERRAAARGRAARGDSPWPRAAAAPAPAAGPFDWVRRRRRGDRVDRAAGVAGVAAAELAARLAPIYSAPQAAIESWRTLRAELEARGESGGYADWWLAHRPEAFGEVTMAAWRRSSRGPVAVLAGDRAFRRLARAAAAEILAPPPAAVPGPAAAAAAERLTRVAAARRGAAAQARAIADLVKIERSLGRVAAELTRDAADDEAVSLGGRVRAAARAAVTAAARSRPRQPQMPTREPPRDPRDRARGDA